MLGGCVRFLDCWSFLCCTRVCVGPSALACKHRCLIHKPGSPSPSPPFQGGEARSAAREERAWAVGFVWERGAFRSVDAAAVVVWSMCSERVLSAPVRNRHVLLQPPRSPFLSTQARQSRGVPLQSLPQAQLQQAAAQHP